MEFPGSNSLFEPRELELETRFDTGVLLFGSLDRASRIAALDRKSGRVASLMGRTFFCSRRVEEVVLVRDRADSIALVCFVVDDSDGRACNLAFFRGLFSAADTGLLFDRSFGETLPSTESGRGELAFRGDNCDIVRSCCSTLWLGRTSKPSASGSLLSDAQRRHDKPALIDISDVPERADEFLTINHEPFGRFVCRR